MGMSILIEIESEHPDFIIYKFGIDSSGMSKLKINKNTLEFEKLDSTSDSWNYIYFKVGAFIKKQYMENGVFPIRITCAS